MKIIKEDESGLIFEVRPIENIDKWSLAVIFIFILLFFVFGITNNNLSMRGIIYLILIWIVPSFMSFLYFRSKTVHVEVNRQENKILLSGLYDVKLGLSRRPTELNIDQIMKIEYDTFMFPLVLRFFPLFIFFNVGKLVFILKTNERRVVYTFAPMVSYRSFAIIGQKIANYLGIQFSY